MNEELQKGFLLSILVIIILEIYAKEIIRSMDKD